VAVYAFNRRDLFLSYGLALLATVVCVAVGFVAIRKNGGVRSTAFSALVVSAREGSLLKDGTERESLD
jgi:hypothetical protein